MKKALILCVSALFAAPVAAADSAHCDATPFTLGKPVAASAKAPKAQPKPAASAQQAARKPQAKAGGKQRLLATCKESKTKKSS